MLEWSVLGFQAEDILKLQLEIQMICICLHSKIGMCGMKFPSAQPRASSHLPNFLKEKIFSDLKELHYFDFSLFLFPGIRECNASNQFHFPLTI